VVQAVVRTTAKVNGDNEDKRILILYCIIVLHSLRAPIQSNSLDCFSVYSHVSPTDSRKLASHTRIAEMTVC